MRRLLIFVGLLLLLVPLEWRVAQAQEAPTATPDAEGVIYAEVQPNDSLWAIAARHGLTLQELLALNEMTEGAVIRPGDRLIVGQGTPPATATVPLPATPTLPPPPPTATPPPDPTGICLTAYQDSDRDGVHDPGEPLQAAVAFTVYNENTVVANYISDGVSEPHCLQGLESGAYNVTRSLRPREQATTPGDVTISLQRGSVVELAFGSFMAEPGETAVVPSPISAAGQATATQAAPAAIGDNVPPTATTAGSTAAGDAASGIGWVLAGGAFIVILGAIGIVFWAYGRLRGHTIEDD